MFLALPAFLGCTEGEPAPILVPRDPVYVVPIDERPPSWERSGEGGQFTLLRQAPTLTSPQAVRVAAVFGEGIAGGPYPAACGLEGRLCVDPADGLDVDRFVSSGPITASRFSWLGDRLAVGPEEVPFYVAPEDQGPAGYRGALSLDTPLIDRLTVGYTEGEWGTGSFDVALPPLLTGLEPPPEAEVPVDPTGLQVFRWAPNGGTIFLSLVGPTWSSTRRIEDDGSVWIDTRELRLNEAVEVRLSRVTEQGRIELPGEHTVDVHGLVEQAWCLTDGCPNDPFERYPRPFDFEFCWSASSCSTSSFRMQEDGTWRSGSLAGTWTFDCCRESIEFAFNSGTRYWATRGEDGCYAGEMLSWSGSSGTWSACP